MTDSSSPVLDLSTLSPDRPTIRIRSSGNPDGELYEIAAFDDLSIADQQFLYSRGTRMEKLMSSRRQLSKDQKDELDRIFGGLVGIILPDLPDDVLKELGGGHKVKIIEAFMLASPDLKARAEAAQAAAAGLTTAS